jgi:serine/threonine protein kinase
VCPSNIYLSVQGSVKLGDFGIARVRAKQTGTTPHTTNGHIGYLAPEQLTGEPTGTWSDIYSLGVILGELLIGEPIFSGSGQLATMLSIRDGRIDPLRRAAPNLPKGLVEICERALARDPAARYATAEAFALELMPFEATAGLDLRLSLAGWVSWAKNNARLASELEQHVRESVGFMRAVRGASTQTLQSPSDSGSGLQSSRTAASQHMREEFCRIRRSATDPGETIQVSRLIELLATGYLGARDEVCFDAEPFIALSQIPELARHILPSSSTVTSVLFTPGPPDYVADFADTPFLRVLAKLYTESATGSLFVLDSADGKQNRKDLYFRAGRLVHVASSDRQELLGEYLVRVRSYAAR